MKSQVHNFKCIYAVFINQPWFVVFCIDYCYILAYDGSVQFVYFPLASLDIVLFLIGKGRLLKLQFYLDEYLQA